MKVIPGLLEYSQESFRKKIGQIPDAFHRVHIDVIGKNFAKKETIKPWEWTGLVGINQIGCHLMLDNPFFLIGESVKAGANLIIGQMEKINDLSGFVDRVQGEGVQVGLAIDLGTKIEVVDFEIGRCVDSWLVLAVKAGYSGQEFNRGVLDKVEELRNKFGNNAEILIDGGVNGGNISDCVKSGADGVIINSALWENFEYNLAKFEELATI
jgi:ribulose-phosphate 3-epimerase